MTITSEQREAIIQYKNDNVRNVLFFLEGRSSLLSLNWETYNEVRNVIRYEGNRNLNRILRLLGDTETVRLSRADDANG